MCARGLPRDGSPPPVSNRPAPLPQASSATTVPAASRPTSVLAGPLAQSPDGRPGPTPAGASGAWSPPASGGGGGYGGAADEGDSDGQQCGVGLALRHEELPGGRVVVVEWVMPGGAAAAGGHVQKGDMLIAVREAGGGQVGERRRVGGRGVGMGWGAHGSARARGAERGK